VRLEYLSCRRKRHWGWASLLAQRGRVNLRWHEHNLYDLIEKWTFGEKKGTH